MVEEETYALTVTIDPSNADDKSVSWTSSQPSIASVQDGVITAHKEGNTIITVKSTDGGKTAKCSITVSAKVISVTGLSLDKTTVELTEGDETNLTATVTPDNATNKNVTWTSSDESVATVDDGKVTAMEEGVTTITVITEDGGKTAKCEVKVAARAFPVESVSLDKTSVELIAGDEIILTATIAPDNATNKNVIWTSSDESVATVANGKVTALKEGATTITVTTEEGKKTASCDVIVLHDPSNDAIVFADKIMKKMCVSAFDINRDGELSYKEAAAVTDLSQMKLTKKAFKSFDEFQYFTHVKYIPNEYFKETGLKSIVLPEGVEHIGTEAFYACHSLASLVIPDSVSSISTSTFSECSSLTSVVIPNTVTSIGEGAFAGCINLTSIVIPDSVTTIGRKAFYDCHSLASLTIPDSVSSIGNLAFSGCRSLTSLVIPDSVNSIGISAFKDCNSLTSIVIPDSVTSIESTTFWGCGNLTSIIIPNSVTSIGRWAFYACISLTDVVISESVTSIAFGAFDGCFSLTSVVIPDSVTRIEASTFANCTSLTSVVIPDSVTSIGNDAFWECKSLESIKIPESVTEIGEYAFYCCLNLADIYVRNIFPCSLGREVFDGIHSFKIFVPQSSLEQYKTAEGWSNYTDYIVGYDYENNKVVE